MNSSSNPQEKNLAAEQKQRRFSSEETDKTLNIVNPHFWITYLILFIVTIAILLWSFFGWIPIKLEGRGIFVSPKGLFTIQAKVPGIVQNLAVKSGDYVKKGDLIARIIEPQDELRLSLAKAKLDIITKDLKRLDREIESERKKEKEGISAQIEANLLNVKRYEDEINSLKKVVDTRTNLVKEGLLSVNSLRDSERELNQRQITLQSVKAELATLQSNLHKSYRTEEYKNKEQQYLQAKQEHELLRMTHEYSEIYSPFNGYVLENLENEGDRVAAGDSILLLEHVKRGLKRYTNLIVYGFVPVEEGKRIKIGTPVQMEVSTVDKDEYGLLLGTVKEVSQFASSPERLLKIIPNKTLIEYLVGTQKAVIQLTIVPELDSSTVSGYKWTTAEGPPIEITTGTVSIIRAIIEKVRPFYYVFPLEEFRQINVEK